MHLCEIYPYQTKMQDFDWDNREVERSVDQRQMSTLFWKTDPAILKLRQEIRSVILWYIFNLYSNFRL
jgi:hypothetical protein